MQAFRFTRKLTKIYSKIFTAHHLAHFTLPFSHWVTCLTCYAHVCLTFTSIPFCQLHICGTAQLRWQISLSLLFFSAHSHWHLSCPFYGLLPGAHWPNSIPSYLERLCKLMAETSNFASNHWVLINQLIGWPAVDHSSDGEHVCSSTRSTPVRTGHAQSGSCVWACVWTYFICVSVIR